MSRGRWKKLATMAALVLGCDLATAVVTASGSDAAVPVGLDLRGVGALSNGCSSVLLAGGQWLLGAAHCAAGVGATVSFAGGATASITELVFAPDWLPARQVAVNDLALMRIDAAPAGIAGFSIASQPVLGRSIVVAGYGAAGNGVTGAALPAGSLHVGFNEYEARLADGGGASYGGHALLFDFDDGSEAASRFGSQGLGAFEAMTAGLDSGGPSFIYEQGEWRIAGIHTGVVGEYGTAFGGIGVDLQPAYLASWIGQVTAIPEPDGAWAMLLGMAVLVLLPGRAASFAALTTTRRRAPGSPAAWRSGRARSSIRLSDFRR